MKENIKESLQFILQHPAIGSPLVQHAQNLARHISTQTEPQVTDEQIILSALERMDRARNILTSGNPTPERNWGMLDTSDLRALLSAPPAAETPKTTRMGLVMQLREYASDPGFSHNDYADSMHMAADEIEKFENIAIFMAAPQETKPATEVYALRVHAWGGSTECHDYEMSDGSVQTFHASEVPWATKPSVFHTQEAKPVAADGARQDEAHKLARILFGMIEGDGRVEGADIYAEGYSPPDGDVFVLRAAELLIEQAAESKELTRYVEHFAIAAKQATPQEQAPADKDAEHQKTIARLFEQEERACRAEDALIEVIGCFDAANAEGLQDAIAETNDERLKDLLTRRVLHAYYAALQSQPQQVTK